MKSRPLSSASARAPIAAVLAAIVLSLVVSGCQVAGIGAPDATPVPTAAPTTAAPTTAPPTAAPAGGSGAKQWSNPPASTIDVNKTYDVVMHTNKGDFTITLLPREAPLAANNFLFLAHQHFFDGVVFHRILAGFVIQGGDPQGTGVGGPGYGFAIEPPRHEAYVKGIVAMANTGQPNSNGSQFFVVLADLRASLPRTYSIFGKVTAGMDTIDRIAAVPTTDNGQGEKSKPLVDVHIISTMVRGG